MTKVDEIKAAIAALPEDQYAQLRRWLTERDAALWDQQIEADSASGRLHSLIREADREKRAERLDGSRAPACH